MPATYPEYPEELKPTFWAKKKGSIPDGSELADKLKALQKKHEAIEWKLFEPGWPDEAKSEDELELAFSKRDKLYRSNVLALKREAGIVVSSAKALEKGAAKPTLDAAKAIGSALGTYSKEIDAGAEHLKTLFDKAQQALSKAALDEEPASALMDPKGLLKQLNLCKHDPDRSVHFAFLDGKSKEEPPILVMSPRVNGRMLFGKLQQETGRKAGAFGTAWLKDNSLMLQLDKPLSGLVKKVRGPVKAAGFRVAKVVLWNEDGSVFEQDDEVERQDDGNADDIVWAHLNNTLQHRVAIALQLNNADTSRIRAAWMAAQDKANAGEFAAAVEIARRLEPLLAEATPSAGTGETEGEGGDEAKWKASSARIAQMIEDVIAAGKGDLAKINAVWDFAQGKANDGNFASALASLKPLVQLITEAKAAVKTEAQKEVPKGAVGDRISGAALLEELKSKFAAIKEAMNILPARAQEVAELMKAMPLLVQDKKMPEARVTLTKLDIFVNEAKLRKERNDAAKLRVESLVTAYGLRYVAQAAAPDGQLGMAALRQVYQNSLMQVTAQTLKNNFVEAEPLLEAVENALKDVEARKLQYDAKLRVDPLVADYGQRYVAQAGLPDTVPGVLDLRKSYVDVLALVTAQTTQGKFIEAEPLLPAVNKALASVEARKTAFDIDKAKFIEERDGIADDLARTLKIGSVTPDMGTLRKALLAQKKIVDDAVAIEDYKTALPQQIRLADRLAAIDSAKDRYDEAKAEWEKEIAAARQRIDAVAGCGPINSALDLLKANFTLALTDARAKAKVNDYPQARLQLAAALVHADKFLLDKGQLDAQRALALKGLREQGARTLPNLAGQQLGATDAAKDVEDAMKDNSDLRTSKGLIALVAESKLIDGLYASASNGVQGDACDNVRLSAENLLLKIAEYQEDHKSSSKSKTDREKHAQAAALDVHHRLQISYLATIAPQLRSLQAINPSALAATPDDAAKAIGWLDAFLASAAMDAPKAVAKTKRLAIVGALMKAATTRDGIRLAAELGGPAFKASFERQDALGPLSGTTKASKAREKHAGTKIQNMAGAENVDQSRALAGRLIADDGSFEIAALYAFDPKDLAGDKPASQQMARALTKLKESPEALATLDAIPAPKEQQSAAARMIRAALGLAKDEPVTAAHARKAALSSLLSELRQGDVGSCFATQVAIRIHDTDPAAFLKDMSQMIAEGKITRIVEGQEVTVNVQGKMSDAELKNHGVKLSRGPTPDLKGSRMGGTLPTPAKLETAPGFKAAMTAMGITDGGATAAMNGALVEMQASQAFAKNQNEKAIRKAVASIADSATRQKVLDLAMAKVTHDRASVKQALADAMANPNPGVTPIVPVPPTDQGKANTAYDALLDAPDFDVEPNLVVDALIRGQLGLTEADVLRAEANEKLRSEITTHPDMRSGKQLALPADKPLLDLLKKLEDEDEALKPKRAKLAQLEPMKQAAFDQYLGEDQNRMLRAYEYTLTSLAEKSTTRHKMQDQQEREISVVKGEMDDLANRIIAEPDFKKAKVKAPAVNEITTKLMASYQRVFKAGTSAGYDASVGTKVSSDGSSSRGVWALFDTQGIKDPDRWIKIDDAKAYGRLVQGMMMLAWSETYGKEKDKNVAALSRRIADELSETIRSEGFAQKLSQKAKTDQGDQSVEPWRLGGGGMGAGTIEVVDGRMPETTQLGNPTDDHDMMEKLGTELKRLWDTPSTGTKANADRDGDAATVQTRTVGVHAFSLVPGEPGLRALLEDPRSFNEALADHVVKEKTKWTNAQNDTLLSTRDEMAEQLRLIAGANTSANVIDTVWNSIKANPTMKAFNDRVKQLYVSNGRTAAQADAIISKHAIGNLVPPVAAADLDRKLEKVARSLEVPDDLMTLITTNAKNSLTTQDPAKASMTSIKKEIVIAMQAEGIDTATVTQAKVTAALREPAGVVFADMNWGDAGARTKYALVVNPITGVSEVWAMDQDGANPRLADKAKYVTAEWHVIN